MNMVSLLITMKQSELQNLRIKYINLQDQLISTIEKSNYEIDIDGDEIDEIQGKSIIAIQDQLSQNNLKKLRAIQLAIQRIDNNDYGDCEECGEAIGIKRLEAIPGVSICVCCAELIEKLQ